MSEIRPDILKAAEKFGDWDEHVRSCDAVRDMTDEEKEKAKRAFQYLRRVLREGFLRRAFIKRHPIIGPVLNATRHDRLWIIELAEALVELREAEGFPEVFRRFKKPEDSVEAESVLSTAFRFKKAGFTVAFDPRVIVTRQDGQRRQKHPDLKLVNDETGEEVIVEVSVLERSAAHRKAFDLSGFSIAVLDMLRPANLTICMEMREGFDESYAAEAFRLLTKVADEVARAGEFRAVVNGRMAAGIAPEDNVEQLRRWAEEQGASPGLTGPPVYSDEISRARMKIRDKLAQLPEDRPGLIVIPATASMMFNFYDPRLILEVLREEVGRYPRLWAVVLLHNYVGGPQREPVVMRLGSSVLIDKTESEGLSAATVKLFAEPQRASQIALAEADRAAGMLRVFSPACLEPEAVSFCAPLGKEHSEARKWLTVEGGRIASYNDYYDRGVPVPYVLDDQRIEEHDEEGLGILSYILAKESLTEYEEALIASLLLYSKCALAKDPADKLIAILVALESMLLKDANEPIQQNLAERMAFLFDAPADERKKTKASVIRAYGLRSSFIHHGRGVGTDDLDALREFMMTAWTSFYALIQYSGRYATKAQLFERLEELKMS